MKITRSVRFSENILRGIAWVQRHEGGDTSEAIRRLLRKGLEREMADLYAQGRVSLREVADVLSVPLREALELLWQLGVSGNITTSQALAAAEVARTLGD